MCVFTIMEGSSTEEELERREEKVEVKLDQKEAEIFRRHPEAKKHEHIYSDFIFEYVSSVSEVQGGDESYVEELLFETEEGIAIEQLEFWIIEYENMHAGRRGAIDPNEVVFEWNGVTRNFEFLNTVMGYWSRGLLEDVPGDFFVEDVVEELENIDPDRSNPSLPPELDLKIIPQLARIWLTDYFKQTEIAIVSKLEEVEMEVNVLKLLSSNQFMTAREARQNIILDRAFTQERRKFRERAGTLKPVDTWTLRDVVTNMGFVVEWARMKERKGTDIDTPFDLGVLPSKIVSSIQSIVNQPQFEQLGSVHPSGKPKRKTHFDRVMVEIRQRIEKMARDKDFLVIKLDKAFFEDFPSGIMVDAKMGRIEENVADVKLILRLVQDQPDGNSARTAFDKFKPFILNIREMLVRDIEWLLDDNNLQEFLHQVFDHPIEEIRETNPAWWSNIEKADLENIKKMLGRRMSKGVLENHIKKAITALSAAQDWILRLMDRIERVVDERDPPVEHKGKRRRMYATSRARRRVLALHRISIENRVSVGKKRDVEFDLFF